ncbi:uncharacterized protein PSFLO_00904 [Pseudozyma flocculosa]|uniref:Uncharacterized protein n=1 Tax=Pseudozyma flocculosa TaxID=84751 RepID=A0A5C3ESW2_9BASI|nr:uncharacterized protein PSFLO_00904 [Pseudozyma flocculosa]
MVGRGDQVKKDLQRRRLNACTTSRAQPLPSQPQRGGWRALDAMFNHESTRGTHKQAGRGGRCLPSLVCHSVAGVGSKKQGWRDHRRWFDGTARPARTQSTVTAGKRAQPRASIWWWRPNWLAAQQIATLPRRR